MHSKTGSIDSNSLNNDWKDLTKRLYGLNSNISMALNPKHTSSSFIYSSKESLTSITTTTNPSTNSINKMKTNTLEETYSFAGVHHIFNNHKGAGI